MRIARVLTVAAVLVALTATPAVADRDLQPSANDSVVQKSELRAQAVANHLSPEQARSLQDRVDRVVARTDGTQVAINQVRWDGGDTLIPLPGEARARELGGAPRGTVYGCPYLQFCTYEHNFIGMVDRMESCVLHYTPFKFRSYVNNQTAGTHARFYDINLDRTSYTKPAFATGTTSLSPRRATYIRPC